MSFYFLRFLQLACFMGSCLALWRFDLTVETFVIEFVLAPVFPAVPTLDFDNAYLASASFRWLLLVLSGGSDRFTLVCAIFATITSLCGSLRGPCHLFDKFLIFSNYFYTTLVYFESVVGEPALFSFLRSLGTHSFFLSYEKWERSPLQPFPYSIKKKKLGMFVNVF
jgi:hypothetical protein